MKSNKNEELKSRRDFFKKAAKSALPILGAVVLASSPLVSKAAETAMGCSTSTCYGSCYYSCQNTCKGDCTGSCYRTCRGTCSGDCFQACRSSAY